MVIADSINICIVKEWNPWFSLATLQKVKLFKKIKKKLISPMFCLRGKISLNCIHMHLVIFLQTLIMFWKILNLHLVAELKSQKLLRHHSYPYSQNSCSSSLVHVVSHYLLDKLQILWHNSWWGTGLNPAQHQCLAFLWQSTLPLQCSLPDPLL